MGAIKFVVSGILTVASFLLACVVAIALTVVALCLLSFCIGVPVGAIWWVASHVMSWLP